MRSGRELEDCIARLDERGYKAYGSLSGAWDMGRFHLHVDHVQPDPFASPSRLRVRVPSRVSGFPDWSRCDRVRRVALEDYLTRALDRALWEAGRERTGSGKTGLLEVDRPGQEIMERTSMVVGDDGVEARLSAGLPARGRRIMANAARDMLLEVLPRAVMSALVFAVLNEGDLRRHIEAAEDQRALRAQLEGAGLVAFVGDGSILPRASGVSDLPLTGPGVVRVRSDDALAVTLHAPNSGPIRGVGVRKGVTLIVGGGYHGKSTLLRALERGIYDHVPGDGRERVVTDPTAVKIRAEDGRRVEGVDISAFIGGLPGGIDTSCFQTEAASGSTSQAAAIAEALELGAGCLLVDEDTSATNFMIRDARMQALVVGDREPITPFIDRVRELSETQGVSTVLVLGGSGDYLDVAGTVIMMDEYTPRDVTVAADEVAARLPTGRAGEALGTMAPPSPRRPLPGSLDPLHRGRDRVRSRGLDTIVFGTEHIDITLLEQLVHPGQTRAVGHMIRRAAGLVDGERSLVDVLSAVMDEVDKDGLDVLSLHRGHPGDYARVRLIELGAAVNRLRSLRVARERGKRDDGNPAGDE